MKPQGLHPALALLILLKSGGVRIPGAPGALSFNTTGLDHCIFHLADGDGGRRIGTRDLLESIVTSSGPDVVVWTLSTIRRCILNW
jgi:hypothetical protein